MIWSVVFWVWDPSKGFPRKRTVTASSLHAPVAQGRFAGTPLSNRGGDAHATDSQCTCPVLQRGWWTSQVAKADTFRQAERSTAEKPNPDAMMVQGAAPAPPRGCVEGSERRRRVHLSGEKGPYFLRGLQAGSFSSSRAVGSHSDLNPFGPTARVPAGEREASAGPRRQGPRSRFRG